MEQERQQNIEDSYEIDMVEYIRLLLKNIKILLVPPIIMAMVTLGYVQLVSLISPQYVSKVEFYSNTINANNTAITYENLLKSDTVLAAVAKNLETRLSYTEIKDNFDTYEDNGNIRIRIYSLKSMIQSSSDQAAKNITISAFSGDGEMAAQICRAISESAPKAVEEIHKGANLVSINKDTFYYTKASTGSEKKVVLAGFLGMAVMGGLFTLFFVLKKPVMSIEHIEKKTNIPILGEVSYYSQKGR